MEHRSLSLVQTGSDKDEPAQLLVTVPQAAKILSISRSALYQLIWNGDINTIHIGRSVRVSIEELHRFVDTSSDRD